MTPDLFNCELIADVHNRFNSLGCAQLNDASRKRTIPLDGSIVNRIRHMKLSGPAYPVNAENDMLPGLQALYTAPRGAVLFINNVAPVSEALVGDIFVLDAARRGLGGIVVNGAIRDLDDIEELGVPVFSRSVTFISAKTAVSPSRVVPDRVSVSGVEIVPGDWIFGDNDGMLVVRRQHVSAVLNGALVVEKREAALKVAIASGQSLGDLSGLPGFLAGQGPLKFEI